MGFLYYALPASITFLIALSAFFRDTAASKVSVLNWSFVVAAGLLWPITLPFMIWKKLRSRFQPAPGVESEETGFKVEQI